MGLTPERISNQKNHGWVKAWEACPAGSCERYGGNEAGERNREQGQRASQTCPLVSFLSSGYLKVTKGFYQEKT
jgi:hypothetical protein